MKNILLALMSFVIIGCTYNISPVTNTVDLTSKDFSNAKNLKEVKACEFFFLGILGPFGNAQIFKAIQKNNIKKVYVVEKSHSNFIIVQRNCVFIYGEEMTSEEQWKYREK